MKTKRVQLKTFKEYLICDECQTVMEQMIGVLSRENIYVCPNCGHRVNTSEQFPRIIHEPIARVGNVEK